MVVEGLEETEEELEFGETVEQEDWVTHLSSWEKMELHLFHWA